MRSGPSHQFKFDVFDNLHMRQDDSDDMPECTSNAACCRSHIYSPSDDTPHVSPNGQDEYTRGSQEAVGGLVPHDDGAPAVLVDELRLYPLYAQRFQPSASHPNRCSYNSSKARHKHSRTLLSIYSYQCVSMYLADRVYSRHVIAAKLELYHSITTMTPLPSLVLGKL